MIRSYSDLGTVGAGCTYVTRCSSLSAKLQKHAQAENSVGFSTYSSDVYHTRIIHLFSSHTLQSSATSTPFPFLKIKKPLPPFHKPRRTNEQQPKKKEPTTTSNPPHFSKTIFNASFQSCSSVTFPLKNNNEEDFCCPCSFSSCSAEA